VRVLDENPRIGVVGCKQLDGQDRLQLTWGRFPSFFNEIARKALHWRLRIDGAQVREYLDREYHGASRVDWVAGSCLLARREAVEDAGLLDENIFLYFEDIDWCRRIQRQGWEILYEPGIRIIHYGGQSAKRHLIDALVAYRRSQFYFCRKYFGATALIALKVLVAAKSLLAFVRHSVAWLAAGGNREERFRAYCMLLTLKKIVQSLFEPVPGEPSSPPRLSTRPAPLEILEPAAAQAREAR
jgi:GT2 family glycosyltransferase